MHLQGVQVELGADSIVFIKCHGWIRQSSGLLTACCPVHLRPRCGCKRGSLTNWGKQGNVVVSTFGLELLPCLRALDLSYNLITSLEEVFRLGGTFSAPVS